jgi:hypothetical protein
MGRASTGRLAGGATWPRLAKLLRVLVAGGAAFSGTCATAPKSAPDKKEASQPTSPSAPPAKQPEPEPGGGVRGW